MTSHIAALAEKSLHAQLKQRYAEPGDLPDPFTCRDLSAAAGIPQSLAQKMTCCLRHMGVLTIAGKQVNALLYRREEA